MRYWDYYCYRSQRTASVSTAKKPLLCQKNWLKNVCNKCSSAKCLKLTYQERIEVLNDVSASTSSSTQSSTDALPQKVGKCVDATLTGKATRFEGAIAGKTGGEINIQFSNQLGLYVTEIPYLFVRWGIIQNLCIRCISQLFLYTYI